MSTVEEDRICSRGYWDPATDHPHLLDPVAPSTDNNATDATSRGRSIKKPATVDQLLREELFLYAKKNMALVNVYIKDPVVTRIKRDQKIPLIGFVANTGGLLGLCMGFSLVSAFEIVYHCFINCCKR